MTTTGYLVTHRNKSPGLRGKWPWLADFDVCADIAEAARILGTERAERPAEAPSEHAILPVGAPLTAEQIGVLKAATEQQRFVVIPVPTVAYKADGDTDAAAFRRAATNLDRGYPAGGSNVRAAVSALLRSVATAVDATTESETR